MRKIILIILSIILLGLIGGAVYLIMTGKLKDLDDEIMNSGIGQNESELTDLSNIFYVLEQFDGAFHIAPEFLEDDNFTLIETMNSEVIAYKQPMSWGEFSFIDSFGNTIETAENGDYYIHQIGTYYDEEDYFHEQGYTKEGDIFEIIEYSDYSEIYTGRWNYDSETEQYDFEILYENIDGEESGLEDWHPDYLRGLLDEDYEDDEDFEEESEEEEVVKYTEDGVRINPTGKYVTITGQLIKEGFDPSKLTAGAKKVNSNTQENASSKNREYSVNGYKIIVKEFIKNDEDKHILDIEYTRPSGDAPTLSEIFPAEFYFKVYNMGEAPEVTTYIDEISDSCLGLKGKLKLIIPSSKAHAMYDLDGWKIVNDEEYMMNLDSNKEKEYFNYLSLQDEGSRLTPEFSINSVDSFTQRDLFYYITVSSVTRDSIKIKTELREEIDKVAPNLKYEIGSIKGTIEGVTEVTVDISQEELDAKGLTFTIGYTEWKIIY